MIDETTRLASQVIAQGLLGGEALLDREHVPAPPAGHELIRLLGRGGGGAVYLGRDTRLDRLAAIKFLHDARAADLERFRREARFTARLNIPSIVQVYEMGEADGRPYIAMQYLDGGNLATAGLSVREAVRVLRDAAAALKHAHDAGIVHRDIKPENILLDRHGHAYVADFGIAHELRAGSAGASALTMEGQIIGTPGLMPPEQARGEVHAIDARSDVYALGATLYLTLTGHYPFHGGNVVEVLHAVMHDEPPMPRSLNAEIPRAAEAVILRCMKKRRGDRYQHMAEVINDLNRFLADGSVQQESAAWFRRLVSGPAPALSFNGQEDTADWASMMEAQRELAAWDGDLYRISGSLERAFARLDELCHRLDEMLARRPDLAWARFYRGAARLRRGRLDEALEDMERSIDRVGHPASAFFELGQLYLALHLKQQREARKHLSRSGVEEDLRASKRRLKQAVTALQEGQRLRGEQLGASLSMAGGPGPVPWHDAFTRAVERLAEDEFDTCVEICDEILEKDPDIEHVWKLRGDAQRLAGVDPVESYDRALNIRRSYFEAQYSRGEALLQLGRIAEARASLQRAIDIHPQFVEAIALLAQSHLVESLQGGAGDGIENAAQLAQRAREVDPQNYDAAITLAEIEIAAARCGLGAGWLDRAMHTLGQARHLPGCQNRVNLLIASVQLEQAKSETVPGGDRDAMLREIISQAERIRAMDWDHSAWDEIRDEALRIRDQKCG